MAVKVVGIRGSGSGVFIKSDKLGSVILTNKHVALINEMSMILPGPRIQNYYNFLVLVDGRLFAANVISTSENADLTLLFIPDIKNHSVAKIATDQGEAGDELICAGAPLGEPSMVVTGFLAKYYTDPSEMMIEASMPIAPGNSGSAVFNKKGEIIGLVTQGTHDFEHLAILTPLFQIRMFLGGLL